MSDCIKFKKNTFGYAVLFPLCDSISDEFTSSVMLLKPIHSKMTELHTSCTSPMPPLTPLMTMHATPPRGGFFPGKNGDLWGVLWLHFRMVQSHDLFLGLFFVARMARSHASAARDRNEGWHEILRTPLQEM